MKKIRLLAILLAILMIPFSMLFACKDDEVVEDPEEEGDDAEAAPESPKAPVVYDDDGSAPGYLMFFHFDAAGRGNLNIVAPVKNASDFTKDFKEEAPYSTYLTGSYQAGTAYTVRYDDVEGSNYLSIERYEKKAAPIFTVDIKNSLADDLESDHMLEFSLNFRDGLFASPVDIYGLKGSVKNTFITIEQDIDGAVLMKDGDGATIYGDKATDKKGWITVSLVVSDASRQYEIYVDGYRQTNGPEYSAATYKSWNEEQTEAYCFTIRGAEDQTYCGIDNLGLRNGDIDYLGIHKGVDVLENFSARIPTYYSVAKISREGVLKFYPTPTATTTFSSDIFDSKLFMSNALTLTKISVDEDENAVFEDLMHQYGVEAGLHDAVSVFYNGDAYLKTWYEVAPLEEDETYDGSAVEYVGYVLYDADKTVDGGLVSGTFTVSNNVITFDWGTDVQAPKYGDADVLYAKYASGVLTLYTDAAAATAVADGAFALYTETAPYANNEYKGANDVINATIVVDPFMGTVSMSITAEDAEPVEGVFAYTVDGNVITANGLTFIYDEVQNVFKYGELSLVQTKVAAPEEVLGPDDRLAIKWTNFKSGILQNFNCPVDTTWWQESYSEYNKFIFEFYADKKLVEDGFQFLIYFDCGQNNGSSYYSMVFDSDITGNGKYTYQEGWNTAEFEITSLAPTRTPDIKKLANVRLVVTGWSNGPTDDNDGIDGNGDGDYDGGKTDGDTKPCDVANDGYSIYISKFSFIKDAVVSLDGPSKEKAECTHQNNMGQSYYEKVDTAIPGNCIHGSYYIVRCSECGATKIDEERPIGMPVDHEFGDDVKVIAATCEEEGYYYKECRNCGYHYIQSRIPANGHNERAEQDPSDARRIHFLCVICGKQRTTILYDSLISFTQKIQDGGLTASQYLYTAEGVNDNVTADGSSGEKGLSSSLFPDGGYIQGPMRYSTLKSVQVNGKYAFEIKMATKGSASNHTYLSHQGVGSKADFSFVYEFDVMLGSKTSEGKYLGFDLSGCDRNHKDSAGAGKNMDLTLFSVSNTTGILTLSSVSNATGSVQLSDTKFTNIAYVFNAETGMCYIYADGKLACEGQFSSSKGHANPGDYWVNEFRLNMNQGDGVKGGSNYFNNITYYPGTEPICVVSDIQFVEEATGDVALKDEDGYDMYPGFTVDRVDVDVFLNPYDYVTKYVIDFTLDATGIRNGVILEGTKRGAGYDRVGTLLYVEGGRLYSNGRLISESLEDVRICLAINDVTGTITAYVNGEALDGVITYNDAVYGDNVGRIRSFCFKNDNGSYTVSGLSMYAGENIK